MYGVPVHLPVNEDAECSPASPYGRTKLQAEMMIRDVCRRYNGKEVDKRISAVILRYFNPVGKENT